MKITIELLSGLHCCSWSTVKYNGSFQTQCEGEGAIHISMLPKKSQPDKRLNVEVSNY